MTPINKDLITILGPTACGKTSLAVSLAKKIKAEIISADSRQVYKNMDIGTGKDIDEYTIDNYKIPYHLIDIIDAGEKYNIYQYQKDFLKIYQKLSANNITPILCGGSGMYIESILKGYNLTYTPIDYDLRINLQKQSLTELNNKLKTLKILHNSSDSKDKDTIIRAIEIELSKNNSNNNFPKLNSFIFGINYQRDIIKKRITLRLKERLRNGLIDEVNNLITNGISKETLIYYGLEYKYITLFLSKELSYNEMFKLLNIAIHQFSKKQMTWFRRMERNGLKIHWIGGNLPTNTKIENILEIINLKNEK